MKKRITRYLDKQKHLFHFLKALALNPKGTGAIVPSSKQLAKTMAAFLNPLEDSLVVELGPGTGVITEAILERGIAPHRLIVIEYAPHLAKALRKRFPDITVIEGDAADLPALLQDQAKLVGAIVSALPLRSLPKTMKKAILMAIPKVLSDQGRYIQFTYDLRQQQNFYPKHYVLMRSTIVWRNMPPARVGVYRMNDVSHKHE